MDQLKTRFSTTDRAETFTRSVSHKDHSSVKISAQTDHPKWEIVSEGGGALNSVQERCKHWKQIKRDLRQLKK
jgi:hypothetical protein